MTESEKQALQAFVDELSALSEKHSFVISNDGGSHRGTFNIDSAGRRHFGFSYNYDTYKYESEGLK